STLLARPAVEELVQPFGEGPSAPRWLHGITQRHLLEGEQQVRPRFDRDGLRCDLRKLPLAKQPTEGRASERDHPARVGFPLVAALPVDVGLVGKTAGEESQELAAAHERRRRHRGLRSNRLTTTTARPPELSCFRCARSHVLPPDSCC